MFAVLLRCHPDGEREHEGGQSGEWREAAQVEQCGHTTEGRQVGVHLAAEDFPGCRTELQETKL